MSAPHKKQKPAFLALKPRRCKYCRAVFVPNRPQDAEAKFCEPNHRKAYHKYGGLPFDKLMERVRKEVRVIVREELSLAFSEREGSAPSTLDRGA